MCRLQDLCCCNGISLVCCHTKGNFFKMFSSVFCKKMYMKLHEWVNINKTFLSLIGHTECGMSGLILCWMSVLSKQADNSEAAEGSGPCPNTREWTCLSKPFSVNTGLEGHTYIFEILRVIKILFCESVSLVTQSAYMMWAVLHSPDSLYQNDPLCRHILELWAKGRWGVIFQLASAKWAISTSFRVYLWSRCRRHEKGSL